MFKVQADWEFASLAKGSQPVGMIAKRVHLILMQHA